MTIGYLNFKFCGTNFEKSHCRFRTAGIANKSSLKSSVSEVEDGLTIFQGFVISMPVKVQYDNSIIDFRPTKIQKNVYFCTSKSDFIHN